MKKYLWGLIFVFSFLVAACGSMPRASYNFTGNQVFDYENGIMISGGSGFITIVNTKDHYSLILPFKVPCKFSLGGDYLLWGESGGMIISLKKVFYQKSRKEFLEEYKQNLENARNKVGLTNAEIIEYRGVPILRNEVDPRSLRADYNGPKKLNYFVAKNLKSEFYVLHWSSDLPDPNKSGLKEDEILTFIDSFDVE